MRKLLFSLLLLLATKGTLTGQTHDGHPITEHLQVETNGIVLAKLELRPTTNSLIRAVVALPPVDRWNGRLWFFGHGGPAGSLWPDRVRHQANQGSVAVHTDMGTSQRQEKLPPEVITDFGHRATHLALQAARELTKRKLGRYPNKCYFVGESTGGGQGIHAALRYPKDFDGILSGVPANLRTALHTYFWWLRRELCLDGKASVFTPEEALAVAQSAKDLLGRNDPEWCRGKWLADPHWSPERAKAVIAEACRRVPSLAEGDKPQRLYRILEGPVIDGKPIHTGLPFGTFLHDYRALDGVQFPLLWYFGRNVDVNTLTEEDIKGWIAACASDLDAVGADFNAFHQNGGKLIIWVGLEDLIVPAEPIMKWYTQVRQALGTTRADECIRLYPLIGRQHSGSPKQSRGMMGFGNQGMSVIEDWVERGIAPSAMQVHCGDGTVRDVEPYQP